AGGSAPGTPAPPARCATSTTPRVPVPTERRRCLRQPPLQASGRERPGLRDRRPRVIHLSPRVPQQDAAHPPALEIVDHTFPKRRQPILHRFQPRVHVPNGLITELEQIRVKEG